MKEFTIDEIRLLLPEIFEDISDEVISVFIDFFNLSLDDKEDFKILFNEYY